MTASVRSVAVNGSVHMVWSHEINKTVRQSGRVIRNTGMPEEALPAQIEEADPAETPDENQTTRQRPEWWPGDPVLGDFQCARRAADDDSEEEEEDLDYFYDDDEDDLEDDEDEYDDEFEDDELDDDDDEEDEDF